MNMFEEAEALLGTVSLCKITQEDFADKLGVSQSYVANKLRLLKLPEKVKCAIVDGGLTERHARAVLRLQDEDLQLKAVEMMAQGKMTVAEGEDLIEVLCSSNSESVDLTDKIDRLLTNICRTYIQRNVCISKSVEENELGTKISLFIEKRREIRGD